MVAGMQRIIRETGAEYTNCYLHICTDTVLRNCNISRFGNREFLQIFCRYGRMLCSCRIRRFFYFR